jgi:hypothetical protein
MQGDKEGVSTVFLREDFCPGADLKGKIAVKYSFSGVSLGILGSDDIIGWAILPFSIKFRRRPKNMLETTVLHCTVITCPSSIPCPKSFIRAGQNVDSF